MMRGPLYWEFVVVTAPFEKIKVLRTRGGKPDNVYGTYPRGFSCMMGVGDKVLVKFPGKSWLLKFKVVVHPDDYLAIKYGKKWGPLAGQYRALKNLTEAAFNNAGIDPAWVAREKEVKG